MRDVYAQPIPSYLKLLVFGIDLFSLSVIVQGIYPVGSHAENLAGQLVVRLGMKALGGSCMLVMDNRSLCNPDILSLLVSRCALRLSCGAQEQDSEHCIRFDYFIYSIIITVNDSKNARSNAAVDIIEA